ncbi:MAG TPA: hypothetical protein VHP80_07895 [Candidatus Acidoferrum sp.]|nr:hypothetical protein [Candidatus Acidoferrum sp.]
MGTRTLPSVQDDWCAWLPREKDQAYNAFVRQLESAYNMFSVSLDEALEYRRQGQVSKSYQAVLVTPDLASRLAGNLSAMLRALAGHAKHYGTVPNAAPLSPSNFLGPKEQKTARMSDLLSRVLLTQRSQFLHKIGALEEMVCDLGKDFRFAVENLTAVGSLKPAAEWQVIDAAHYDLNTCLRETIVLLKSFFVVLESDQVVAFQRTVRAQSQGVEPPRTVGDRIMRSRRMASVGGQ